MNYFGDRLWPFELGRPGRPAKREDLAIIACERASSDDSPESRTIGVRWASHPRLGFPTKGYKVFRRPSDSEGESQLLGTYVLLATDSWAAFAASAEARRPLLGPYFPSIREEDLGYLLPFIRIVAPLTDTTELSGLTEMIAARMGEVHEEDPELAWLFWQHARPPSIHDLVTDAASAGHVIEFYRGQAMNILMLLALRFEFAALLGLGMDDVAPVESVIYEVEADWDTLLTAHSDPVRTNAPCAPAAPAWLRAKRVPGTVPHPAFASWPEWERPAGLAPLAPDGTPLPPGASIPRSPAAFTALTWAAPPDDGKLIGYGPVLYLLGRYHHAGVSPGDVVTPELPPTAIFTPLVEGEAVLRPDSRPHYLDLPGMEWPPLEGHYHYEIRGLNLLGTVSGPTMTTIRHIDDLAPPAPGGRLRSEPLAIVTEAAPNIGVEVEVEWEAGQDFGGPDTIKFRVDAHWVPLETVPVRVLSALDYGVLDVRLTLASLPAPNERYVGVRLSLPLQEHQIVSATTGTPATMVVRKSNGRLPPAPSDGVIFVAGLPTARSRAASIDRRPAVPVTVTAVTSLAQRRIKVAAAALEAVPPDDRVMIYLHALRASFAATLVAGGQWRIEEPPEERPAAAAWRRWLELPNPVSAIVNSPAIVFPPHRLKFAVAPPAGFTAGLLTLSLVAVDDADYRPSPVRPALDAALVNLMGNESIPTELVLSVRSNAPPAAPETPPWEPNLWLWATSAAIFAEEARYTLLWPAVPGAVRYEIWRALEGAIPDASPTTSRADLRTLGEANGKAFELRSDQVFGPNYIDNLPGRAPTRALYRIRAVNNAGIVGPFSDLIGPVNVPDIRQPPPPNFLKAGATTPAEADRSIAIEWTQPGPLDDIRFDVHHRLGVADAAGAFAIAGSIARRTAPAAGGRFRFVHGGRTAGKPYSYRVVAVREAQDPLDPSGAARRDISSLPSAIGTATAIASGPLAAPAMLTAAVDAAGIRLTWTNSDEYEAIEIWRSEDGRFAAVRAGAAAGDATVYLDAELASGTYFYQLRAKGVSREARTGDIEVVVP